MIAYVAGEPDERALDRAHLRDVIGMEEAERDECVQREERCGRGESEIIGPRRQTRLCQTMILPATLRAQAAASQVSAERLLPGCDLR